jgi:hypothetical protein
VLWILGAGGLYIPLSITRKKRRAFVHYARRRKLEKNVGESSFATGTRQGSDTADPSNHYFRCALYIKRLELARLTIPVVLDLTGGCQKQIDDDAGYAQVD